MNIYAIRDRLIDYFMRAFSAPDDKDVLASVASTINEGDPNSAIAKAPHHFEVWRLGKVTEEGDLRPGKELIADCASLVRQNLREGPLTRGPEAPETRDRQPTAPEGLRSRHAAYNGALPDPTRPTDSPRTETPPAPPGSAERN